MNEILMLPAPAEHAPEISPEIAEAIERVKEAFLKIADAFREIIEKIADRPEDLGRHRPRAGPEEMVAPLQTREEAPGPQEVREADPRESPRHPERGRGMKRREGSRNEICVICGLDWNVPKDLRIRYTGYICPHCTGKERSKRNERQDQEARQDLREKARRDH